MKSIFQFTPLFPMIILEDMMSIAFTSTVNLNGSGMFTCEVVCTPTSKIARGLTLKIVYNGNNNTLRTWATDIENDGKVINNGAVIKLSDKVLSYPRIKLEQAIENFTRTIIDDINKDIVKTIVERCDTYRECEYTESAINDYLIAHMEGDV
jgi:ribosomal 50S subunit-recycling heat shock protein